MPPQALTPAAAKLARFVATAGHSRLTDYVNENRLAILEEIGLAPRTEPILPTIAPTDTLGSHDVSANTDAAHGFSIKDVGGSVKVIFATVDKSVLNDSHNTAMIESVNHIQRQPDGSTLLAEAPDAALAGQDATANDSSALSADRVLRESMKQADRQTRRTVLNAEAENAVRNKGLHDRARTSMEYHEWAHNVRVTVSPAFKSNAEILHDATGGNLDYVGADVIEPGLPPYHAWVQYSDYREAINIVKKYRRLRSACGGKALWTEQGFASKEAAILDDISNDTDYSAIFSTLTALSDWQPTTV